MRLDTYFKKSVAELPNYARRAQPQDPAFLDLTLYIRGLCGRIGAQFFSLQFLLVILVLLRSMVDRNFSAIYKEGGFTHASHQST